MLPCPRCKAKLLEGTEVCYECGAFLERKGEIRNLNEKQVRSLIRTISKNLSSMKAKGGESEIVEKLLSRAMGAADRGSLEEAVICAKEAQRVLRISQKSLRCGKALEKIEKSILSAKKSGAATSPSERALEKAREVLKEADFPQFSYLVAKARESVEEALKQERMKELISRARERISYAKERGANVSQAEAIISEAEKALANRDYEGVRKRSREARLAAEEARRYARVELLLENVASKLSEAKNLKADISEAQEILSKATQALQSNLYLEAQKLAKRAKQAIAGAKTYKRIEDELGVEEGLIEKARRDGVDVSSAEAALIGARKELEERNYLKARELFKKVKLCLKDACKYKRMEDSVALLSSELEELNNIGATTSELEEIVEEARKALKDRDYEEVRKFVQRGKKTAERARRSREKEAILSAVEKIVEKAGQGGVDALSARELLKEVEGAITRGQFSEIESIIEERFQTETAKKITDTGRHLSEVRALIGDLKRADIDISEAEKILESAGKALNEGRLEEVSSILQDVEGIARGLRGSLQKSAEDMIDKALRAVEEAKQAGVGVEDCENLIDSARNSLQDGNLHEAIEFSRIALARAEKVRKRFLEEEARKDAEAMRLAVEQGRKAKERIASMRTLMERLVKAGMDVSMALDSLSKAEEALYEKKFAEADAYLAAAEEVAKGLKANIAKEANALLTKARSNFEEAKKEGVENPEIEAILSKAEDSLREERWEDALSLARNASERIEQARKEKAIKRAREDIEEAKKASSRFVAVKQLLEDLKKANIDIAGAEESLVRAEKALRARNFAEVENHLVGVEEFAKSLKLALGTAARDMIEKAKFGIAKGKEIQIDLPEAISILANAENSFGKGRFDEAIELAKIAEQKAEIAVKRHFEGLEARERENIEKARQRVERLKRIMEDLGKADIEITGSKDAIIKAENAVEEKKFEDIDSILADVEALAESLSVGLKSAAEDLLSKAKSYVEKGREKGLEVTRAEQVLVTAYNSLKEQKYVEALEYSKVIEDIVKDAERLKSLGEVERHIIALRRDIEETKQLGADVARPEELLKEAEEAVSSRKYGDLETYVRNVGLALKEAKKLFLTSKVKNMGSEIAYAKELGVDTKEAEEELKKAEEAIARGEYERIVVYAKKFDDSISEARRVLLTSKARKEIESVEEMIAQAQQVGLQIADAKTLLDLAKKAMEEGNLEGIKKVVHDAREFVEEARKKHIEETYETKMRGLSTMVASAKKIGANVAEAERILKEAEEALKGNNLERADILVKQAEISTGIQVQNFIRNRYPRLLLNLPEKGLQAHAWNRYVFEILNKGKLPARNIDVNFLGDVEVKGLKTIPEIGVDEKKKVEIGLKPKSEGEVPLNVQVFYQRYFDDTKYELKDVRELSVESPGTYIVEDVFLVHSDGRLIAHETRKFREEIDEDIFSGMLTVVQDFVKDSFKDRTRVGLKRLDFGDSKILIERGPNVFLATVLLGEEPVLLPLYMIEVIREIEEKYGHVLRGLSGILDELEGIEEIIRKLIFVTDVEGAHIGELEMSPITSTIKLMGEGRLPSEGEVSFLQKAKSVIEEEDFESAMKFVEKVEGACASSQEEVRAQLREAILSAGKEGEAIDLSDEKMRQYIEVVRRILEAISKAREEAGIDKDWIVGKVAVRASNPEILDAAMAFKKIILHHGNAKDIDIVPWNETWRGMNIDVNVNIDAINRAYSLWTKKIEILLKSQDPWKIKAGVDKGEYCVGVEGQKVRIMPNMVTFTESLPEHVIEKKFSGGIVYLDTRITEELRAEAYARQVVKIIREMREDLKLGKEESIETKISASPELYQLLRNWKDFISSETKSSSLDFVKEELEEGYVIELEIGGETLTISAKASQTS